MKTFFKRLSKHFCPSASVLFVALFCATGCAVLWHHSDPLAGWKPLFGREYEKVDGVIRSDYWDYIRKLPPEQKDRVGPIFLFEGASGQHAVRFTIGLKGTFWEHVLIYDNGNLRIRTIKYAGGHYMS